MSSDNDNKDFVTKEQHNFWISKFSKDLLNLSKANNELNKRVFTLELELKNSKVKVPFYLSKRQYISMVASGSYYIPDLDRVRRRSMIIYNLFYPIFKLYELASDSTYLYIEKASHKVRGFFDRIMFATYKETRKKK